MMNRAVDHPNRQDDAYPDSRFATYLHMPASFLGDCGIRTEDRNGVTGTAIPHHGASGEVLCTEFRTSSEPGLIEEWEDGPYLYGLGLHRLALDAGFVILLERVEDVLVATLNGIPAVGFGTASWWPEQWTRSLTSIPTIYAFFDFEKNARLLRELALGPLADRVFARDCSGEEQLFELHQSDPVSVRWRVAKYEYDSMLLSFVRFWRIGSGWLKP